MFYVNGEFIHSVGAVVNIMRAAHPDKTTEEWFLLLSGWEKPPECKFCGEPCGFLSLSHGYKEWCNSDTCMRTANTTAARKTAAQKKLKTMWGDLLNKPDAPNCIMCNEKINTRKSKSVNGVCSSPSCRANHRNGWARFGDAIPKEEIHNTLLRYLIQTNVPLDAVKKIKPLVKSVTDLKENVYGLFPFNQSSPLTDAQRVVYCEETEKFVFISGKTRAFYKHLEDCGITDEEEKLSILEKTLPECVVRCSYCNEPARITVGGVVLDKLTRPLRSFCNNDHYAKFMIENPDLYEYNDERKENQSKTMIDKITRGEFTPNVTNSWTRSSPIIVDGIRFKSSWESLFYRVMKTSADIQYETIRIPYLDGEKSRNYLVDFEDSDRRVLYEVKPISEFKRRNNIIKLDAALEWCDNNNYKFVHIGEWWFSENLEVIESLCGLEEKELKAISNFKRKRHEHSKARTCKIDQTCG